LAAKSLSEMQTQGRARGAPPTEIGLADFGIPNADLGNSRDRMRSKILDFAFQKRP
jgi:hypothetical protein